MRSPTGRMARLPRPCEPVIGWCANGVAAGSKHTRWRMPHARALPGVFPPALRAHATALACSLPCQQGLPLARWSRAELVRHLAAQPPLAEVSAGTLGRWLATERIQPWRYRMWQHIHDPVAFVSPAAPVLQAYAEAAARLQNGEWLVCIDEKTSREAREAEQAPRAAKRRHCQRQSPRYTRRGARH